MRQQRENGEKEGKKKKQGRRKGEERKLLKRDGENKNRQMKEVSKGMSAAEKKDRSQSLRHDLFSPIILQPQSALSGLLSAITRDCKPITTTNNVKAEVASVIIATAQAGRY